MNSNNLRTDIEKILYDCWDTLCTEYYDGTEAENLKNFADQILSLLEGVIPPEKSIEIPSQYGLKMTDKVEGYNQCIADMREKMK